MSATDNQPSNKNFLSPFGYKFSIKKTPNMNWFIQAVSMPSVSLARTDVSNPFVVFPVGGDHLRFDNLSITFRVDEDLSNYREIYNWLTAIGFPDTFDQYKDLANKTFGGNSGNALPGSGNALYSDATLTLLTSAMNPNLEVTFIDLFPIGLSALQFDSRLTDMQYVEATATFACRKFNINML
jgi:hypothetical protein